MPNASEHDNNVSMCIFIPLLFVWLMQQKILELAAPNQVLQQIKSDCGRTLDQWLSIFFVPRPIIAIHCNPTTLNQNSNKAKSQPKV